MPVTDRWLVLVTGPRMSDELQRFPEEYASFMEASGEVRAQCTRYRASWLVTVIAVRSKVHAEWGDRSKSEPCFIIQKPIDATDGRCIPRSER